MVIRLRRMRLHRAYVVSLTGLCDFRVRVPPLLLLLLKCSNLRDTYLRFCLASVALALRDSE